MKNVLKFLIVVSLIMCGTLTPAGAAGFIYFKDSPIVGEVTDPATNFEAFTTSVIVAQKNTPPTTLGSGQQVEPCDCSNCSAEHCQPRSTLNYEKTTPTYTKRKKDGGSD